VTGSDAFLIAVAAAAATAVASRDGKREHIKTYTPFPLIKTQRTECHVPSVIPRTSSFPSAHR